MMTRAATPGCAVGGRRGPERGPGTAGPLIVVTREERIHLLMRRRGMRCPRLARRLHMRGLEVQADTLYCMLTREVKAGGRGRAAHVEAILDETERILGLEVNNGRAQEVGE